ncbi:MAG: riboflavin biosynthesis protein RibF [Bacteroidaceae bacterium]|nr:riboflavin biosynthesis protein RibF [Bacteroidaceae bacterium]
MSFFATIGFFDGVHRGHRFLLDQLQAEATAAGMQSMAVTFENHPREVLEDGDVAAPLLLTTTEERLSLLRAAGIARVEVLRFTSATASLKAVDFVQQVLLPMGVRGLLMGFNHHFGSDRETTFEALQAQAAGMGVKIKRAVPLPDGPVSSTRIRRTVSLGQMADAAVLLGRPYTLTGTVNHGRQIGRTMGFPTANVVPPARKLLPADGVYFGRVMFSEPRPALINIGTRPTLGEGGERTVEAHIIGYAGDLYDHTLTISINHRHRAEHTFGSLAALQAQLEADRAACLCHYSIDY